MRKPIPPKLRQFARDMRNEPTDAEASLWQMIRAKQLAGMKFRRQHPIENYIVDFICLDEKLIIEVDGSHHVDNSYDQKRDTRLKELGFTVIRFWNDEVLKHSEFAAETILDAAGKRR